MSLTQPFRHALPVSESLFHEALYLTHAGWEIVAPGAPYPQSDAPLFFFEWKEGRTLPEFCLAFLVAGSGEFQTRDCRSRLVAGEAFSLPSGRMAPPSAIDADWLDADVDPLQWR